MEVYKNVKLMKEIKRQEEKCVVTKKKLHIFSLFFICLLSFGTLGISAEKLNISREVKNITSSWAPNITDLGKLKFVINQESTDDVFSHVSNMVLPFENTFVSEESVGVFKVNGLGGLVVKACLDGKVTKIEGELKKSVYISHGKGLVSVYEEIDTLGVKEGDSVKKNSPLGVSDNSIINFKILYRNKTMTGLTIRDGELTFL